MRGEDLTLARLAGNRWLPLETTYDPATRTLSAQITHLSSFGVSPDSGPVSYQVDNHHPYWLWADRWRVPVWTQEDPKRSDGFGKFDLDPPRHLTIELAASLFGRRDYANAFPADDCERLQDLILQEEVAPLLRNSRIFDAYIVAGPQAFCVFVHRLLLSYVPVMPAGSISVFYHRLPWELQKLYPISALDALF